MRAFVLSVILVCGTALPAGAQSYAAFGFPASPTLEVPAFADADLTTLLATLDRLIPQNPSDALWQFARRLQLGRLSQAQEARVLAHLDRLAQARSDGPALVAGPRRMIADLTVGKTAPDITGTDLDGRTFSLREYRGRVVLLAFTAEWCAICRTQIPYERFLAEKYKAWPFTLLGVQTGTSLETARKKQGATNVPDRVWWDAPPGGSNDGRTDGPIAAAWNVIGWPATYLIDAGGVIRFVDVRDEDLLKAVRQLLDAQAIQDAAAAKRR